MQFIYQQGTQYLLKGTGIMVIMHRNLIVLFLQMAWSRMNSGLKPSSISVGTLSVEKDMLGTFGIDI